MSMSNDDTIVDKGSYIVIKRCHDIEPIVPITCPTCRRIMGTYDDMKSYMLLSCCAWCRDIFVTGENAIRRWNNGWRPQYEHVCMILRNQGLL